MHTIKSAPVAYETPQGSQPTAKQLIRPIFGTANEQSLLPYKATSTRKGKHSIEQQQAIVAEIRAVVCSITGVQYQQEHLLYAAFFKLSQKQRQGVFKGIAERMKLPYFQVYNFVRYTWSRQFYVNIRQHSSEIQQLVEQIVKELHHNGKDIEFIRRKALRVVEDKYKDIRLHPEAIRNTVAYRVQQQYEKIKRNKTADEDYQYIIFDKLAEELPQCVLDECYQMGRTEGIYTFVLHHCQQADEDALLLEQQYL